MLQTQRLYAYDLILTDYDCAIAVVMALAPWGIFLMALLSMLTTGTPQAKESVTVSAVAGVGLTAFAVYYIRRRLRIYRAILSRGMALWGQITDVYCRRGRTQVRYAYECDGQVYKGRCSVVGWAHSRMLLGRGVPVVLLVDRDKPAHSLVPDLYL